MSTYAYARVSTGRQASEGESLDVQVRQVRGYADMNGWVIDHAFIEEGVSGSKPLGDRPQGAKLLTCLQPGDVVIAAKLDRLFRSALDALQMVDVLKAKGVKLHLIDLGGDISGNGLSKLFLTIAAAFAEAERDRIRERVTQTKADQKTRGRYLGGRVPFGFVVDDDGALVADEAQQAALRLIDQLAGEGVALRQIAARVEAETGHVITHAGVAKLLKARQSA